MQCEERVYSIRRASSAVGGQNVWSEEKVHIIKNVTLAVRVQYQESRICSMRKRLCSVRRVCTESKGLHLQ